MSMTMTGAGVVQLVSARPFWARGSPVRSPSFDRRLLRLSEEGGERGVHRGPQVYQSSWTVTCYPRKTRTFTSMIVTRVGLSLFAFSLPLIVNFCWARGDAFLTIERVFSTADISFSFLERLDNVSRSNFWSCFRFFVFFVLASCSLNPWFQLLRVFPPRAKRESDLITAWINLVLSYCHYRGIEATKASLRLTNFRSQDCDNDYNTEYELILYAWKLPLWWIIVSTY